MSRQRFPDFVVTRVRGAQRGFVVFDAKYRQGRQAELGEMAVAHIYRDSLRWQGERAVESEWLATAEFQSHSAVGAVKADDGMQEVIARLKQRWSRNA